MLNQLSNEAMNAATYVENYLDCVENFPDELQRLISRMRELDVVYLAKCKEAHYWKAQVDNNPRQKQKCYLKMQQALSAAQEIGDEKMSVVQTMNDKIELRYRSLDQDFRNLDLGREEQSQSDNRDLQVPTTSSATNNAAVPIMERPNKRARRGGKNDNFIENNHNENSSEASSKNQASNSAQKKTAGGKKKKRKSKQNAQVQREDNSPKDEEPLIDPDEPTYCLCDQISYGEMIMCDNDLCPIEWFHFSCVSLTTKPKGKWYCPKCRGDRPNVMKPKAQFLRELEKYNKEKEEKT